MFCQCPVCRRSTPISHEQFDNDLIRCDHCHTMFLAPSPPEHDIDVPEWDDFMSIANERRTVAQMREQADRLLHYFV